MKKSFTIICASAVILFTSCYKLHTLSFGFSSTIEPDGTGLSVMAVEKNIDFVYLTGRIEMETGSVAVQLIDPDDIARFDTTLQAPVIIQVNEWYDALPGYWKLKYTSEQGSGIIDLHMDF